MSKADPVPRRRGSLPGSYSLHRGAKWIRGAADREGLLLHGFARLFVRGCWRRSCFQSGTCLTKVHSELDRLSEDLDYTISVPIETTRPERRKRAESVRTALSGLSKALSAFRVIEALKGANKSTQYVATVGYNSLVTTDEEKIKIEVRLREPLLMEPVNERPRRRYLIR